jgi:uncharacterized protein (DUF362 family)
MLGYEKLAQEKHVNLVNLAEDKTQKIDGYVDGHLVSLRLPDTILNADLRINVPKLKYMTQTKISCALKNIFGCNPMPTKYKLHPQLDQAIVALNKAMPFHLHILDGNIVPTTPPRKLGLIMASTDPVAFDTVAAHIAGINPKTVKHIILAQKEGLGTMNYTAKGKPLQIFKRQFPHKKPTTKLLTVSYTLATKTGLLNTETL